MPTLCKCGCGEPAPDGKEFRRGHWSRTDAAKEGYRQRQKAVAEPNPSGLCMCGCGELTPLAAASSPSRGRRAGQHLRFIPGHHMRGKKGEQHPQWKGGRWEHKGGYIYVYRPEHPAANRDGYVYEHRLVAEEKLGRYLHAHERVHHVNGVKTDNRPENLAVMESQAAHMRLHGTDELQRYYEQHPEKQAEHGRAGGYAHRGMKYKPRE